MIKELNDKFINNCKAKPLHRFRELLQYVKIYKKLTK
ncbi:Uncharacterised protein [Streptococcus pyogenes]|nr:Uncharacterised protein [Streptococcus pyogenes]SQF33462.1 Uncharacterised protein [Streptococcus pyogenes]VHE85839.1 Uncharacterised protein [Streptococcus pyogenes]VHF18382.1 Uncharacterised protein [Streptococcus pyogenes]VHJ04981.1 Uncharacterised protein [Streptococcus pyogenes]